MNSKENEWTELEQECADYFRKNPAYCRCFRELRKKWESYGRTAGRIRLTNVKEDERRALEGLLGRSSQGESDLTFSMQEFQRALQETRFGAIELQQLLEAYFQCELSANKAKRTQKTESRRKFFEKMEQKYPEVADWVSYMHSSKALGYQSLLSEYEKDSDAAEEILGYVNQSLALLKKRQEQGEPPLRLALLATRITGNPHAFDRGRLEGQLLTYALCYQEALLSFPQNAEKRAELYFSCGIQVDEISSTVAAYGIHLETKAGLHPAYEGFIRMGEPYVITLANLAVAVRAYGEGVAGGNTGIAGGRIYIVENEMVFAHLVEGLSGKQQTDASNFGQLAKQSSSLLCTSGQIRTAAFVLLDLLAKSGAEFYYAGDLDPEGMLIADRLWRRYPERTHIWHMTPEDYRISISAEQIDSRRLQMLDHLMNPELQETAQLLRREGRAGYQERLVEELLREILGWGE